MRRPPNRAASVAASRSVRSEWDDPSTPTTTSTGSGVDAGRTTTTGQCALAATCSATEPSRSPAPSLPLAPSTSMRASIDARTSADATRSSPTAVATARSANHVCAVLAASRTRSSADPPAPVRRREQGSVPLAPARGTPAGRRAGPPPPRPPSPAQFGRGHRRRPRP